MQASRYPDENTELENMWGAKGVVMKRRSALGDISNRGASSESKSKNCMADCHQPIQVVAIPSSRVRDIDAPDTMNPQANTAYVNSTFEYYKQQEIEFQVNPGYMAKQEDLNEKMRAILVDWLVEVHLKFNLKSETLYLAIALIDRYLEKRQVIRQQLQLVGVTALLLASKYEEIYPPEVKDLVYVTDRAYTKEQILEMESRMLNTLSFRLSFPSIWPFLNRYLKAADASEVVTQSAYYYAEKALVDFAMVQYLPSVVAASCVTLALQNHHEQLWTPTLAHYSSFSEADIAAPSAALSSIVRRAPRSTLQAVRKKYSSDKFGRVAELVALSK